MTTVSRKTQFVVKVSKLCNLRCTYCYEFEELAKRDRMSHAQLVAMYSHIRDYFIERDRLDGVRTELEIIWHGGEPLLIEPEYYWQTLADQERIFGDAVQVRNVVQTNLTKLDDERMKLLADGFDGAGVSVDIGGTMRVNIAGRDSQAKVLANLDRLAEAGIQVGCITVLTAQNIGQVERIVEFYTSKRLSFRVLPLFDAVTEQQTSAFSVSLADELAALCTLVDLWLESDQLLRPPEPLPGYLATAVRVVQDWQEHRYYSRRDLPRVIMVNTDGECYTLGEPYGDPDWSMGNIFTTPIADLLTSPGFDRSAFEAERRQGVNCLECPLFGHCDGSPVAEGESQRRDTDDNGARLCTARPVIEHIVRRLREGQSVDIERHEALPAPV